MAETNPYEPADSVQQPETQIVPFKRRAWTGIAWAVLGTIPVSGIVALTFRFPVPFAGYQSGLNSVIPAMMAACFYGLVFGGFMALGILAALMSWVATAWKCNTWMIRLSCLTLACIYCLLLATLDWYIGPW